MFVSTKHLHILNRWANVLVYSAVATGTFFLSQKFLPASVRLKLELPENLWVFLTIGFFLLTCLNRMAGFRPNHLRTLFHYPTFLIAPLLSCLSIGFFYSCFLLPDHELIWPLIRAAFAIYLLSLFLGGIINTFSEFLRHSSSSKSKTRNLTGLNKAGLVTFSATDIINWSESESPIDSFTSDFLNFQHRASRVRDYISEKEHNSVAILGHYGSGKTSLSKLVEKLPHRPNEKRLIFASVSCWGFNDAEAAQKTVLKTVVSQISKEADCFAIAGMPSRFVESLSKTSDYIDSVFHFVSPRDPDSQLSQLSPILQAWSARLVVVIEDTERRGEQFDVASIEGLLNRFRGNSDISFIINASPEAKIDFLRLCEHIESIPDLKPEITLKTLADLRDYCRNKYSLDIDLVSRKEFYLTPPWLGAVKHGMWEFDVAKLVATPRKLKALVRRFYHAWETLHGEVDIDELLIASCLRVCAAPAFAFIMRHHSDFPLLAAKDFYQKDTKETPLLLALKKEWHELEEQGFDLMAAEHLVSALVGTSIHPLFDEPQSNRMNPAQRFRARKEYSNRIITETIDKDDLRDQIVLNKVVSAKGNWKPLAKDIVESGEFRNVFDYFQKFLLGTKLSNSDMRQIIKDMFAAIREREGVKASRESDGFDEAIRWFERCQEDIDQMFEYAFGIVLECLPSNLYLAAEIYHRLIDRVAPDNVRLQYGLRLNQSLKSTFMNNGIGLMASGVDAAKPGAIQLLITNFKDFPKWNWLEPILIEGMSTNPKVFYPEVSMILGLPYIADDQVPDFLVNEPSLKGIFPTKSREVMTMLSKNHAFDPSFTNRYQGIDFSLVSMRAQKWLLKSDK